MKILDIALKDMTRSFRSLFALMFMFGIPLLMGGMFSLMFGGLGSGSDGFPIPVTKVAVANLDAGGAGFEAAMAQLPSAADAHSMGDLVLAALEDERFADLLAVTVAESADAARSAVDRQQAGVAIIIPADFSERFSDLSGQAAIELYSDPTLTLGPAVVQSVLAQFIDGVSGAKIAVNVVMKHTGGADPSLAGPIIQKYIAAASSTNPADSLLEARAPSAVKAPSNPYTAIVGLIMAGMTVFYAFFTGGSAAQSILKEEAEGTLPRLFTTPTPLASVLGGKFLAVGLTVAVQMTVLIFVCRWIFGTQWGSALPLAAVILCSIAAASSFGVFVMSLLKTARQGSAVIGLAFTVTGMIGMIKVFAGGASFSGPLDMLSLFVPQGWAVRGLILTMNGAGLVDVLPACAVLLAVSAVCFAVGLYRFQRRFA
jgi:ABC-2 type transport system permease protein